MFYLKDHSHTVVREILFVGIVIGGLTASIRGTHSIGILSFRLRTKATQTASPCGEFLKSFFCAPVCCPIATLVASQIDSVATIRCFISPSHLTLGSPSRT